MKITNIDIIHHQCHGDELENLQQYYDTIYNKDFVNYENHIRNQAISSVLKAERDDFHFEHDFLKRYIKSDIEKDLISNGFFVKKKIRRERLMTVKN